MVSTVYCFDDSSILICQNPDFRSRYEKWPAPTKVSNASCILGSGYESFFVWALRCWKCMQKCRPQSFFLTSTTALHHALWLGQITPESNISGKCIWTFSTSGDAICLNCSLNGVSSVTFITCSVECVQPSSLGSCEKTSWYSAKRDQAEAPSLGGQDSNPLRSNSSNNFSCLCFTASVKLVCTGDSGTHVTATALTTGVFLFRVWVYAVLFLTTTVTFLLPMPNSIWAFCTIRPWGKDPSSICRAQVITLIPSPMWAFLIHVCITWDQMALMVLVSLVVTISSYSRVSDSPATALLSSTVAVAHQTARR